MYPWTLSITIALVYYGAILLMFSKTGNNAVSEACDDFPGLATSLPFLLFGVYLLYTHFAGGINPKIAAEVFLYIWVPCRFITAGQKSGSKPSWWDAAAIFCLWEPFDLHLIGKRPNAIKDALDWPLLAVSSVIIALALWVCLRKISGTKAVLSFRLADFGKVALGILALCTILVPVGLKCGFLNPRDFWHTELSTHGIPEILWRHLATKKFGIYLLKIFATIGLSEEFLFRGIIQNFLQQVMKSQLWPLVFASLLFGSAHLNNGATSIWPYGWNWTYAGFATIAGLAYGLTFRHTRSILYPMLLHGLVDSIWHTLFR